MLHPSFINSCLIISFWFIFTALLFWGPCISTSLTRTRTHNLPLSFSDHLVAPLYSCSQCFTMAFECSGICGKTFATEGQLKTHRKACDHYKVVQERSTQMRKERAALRRQAISQAGSSRIEHQVCCFLSLSRPTPNFISTKADFHCGDKHLVRTVTRLAVGKIQQSRCSRSLETCTNFHTSGASRKCRKRPTACFRSCSRCRAHECRLGYHTKSFFLSGDPTTTTAAFATATTSATSSCSSTASPPRYYYSIRTSYSPASTSFSIPR